MRLIPEAFYNEIQLRVTKIRKEMSLKSIDALIVGSNANIYYTSLRFFRGFVYVPLKGEIIWFVIKPDVYENIENQVYNIRKPEEIPTILKKLSIIFPGNIGLEENELSYAEIIRLRALFPEANFKNSSSVLKNARMTKTPWELNEMKYDGKCHTKVYGQIKDCYKEGMTDLQLQIEIERKLRLQGALGISRVAGNLMEINLGSVISGENADVPSPYEFTMGGAGLNAALPGGANNTTLLKGQTIMIDMNGAFNGYQTDMTRVWCLGKISELAEKAHECSMKILRKLEVEARPGVPVKDLYFHAMEIVEDYNLKEYFMGHKSQVGFIGHGVGIELNEFPVITAKSKDTLEKNMTLAIEPKFVIPNVGAVGVENTYIVTDSGLENITVFPEEIQFF